MGLDHLTLRYLTLVHNPTIGRPCRLQHVVMRHRSSIPSGRSRVAHASFLQSPRRYQFLAELIARMANTTAPTNRSTTTVTPVPP
jgi:hypothetical protein